MFCANFNFQTRPRGVTYEDESDFLVCARCGAEWEDCKILVDDEEY